MRCFLTFFATFILSATTVHAGNLKIELTNFRNDKGNIAIAIYKDEISFKDNKISDAPYTMLLDASGSKTLTLHDLPASTYAISILHDEDKDGTLDMNERDFPVEGYAYSNNVGKLSIPSFKDASFTHSKDADTVQTIKMIYIK